MPSASLSDTTFKTQGATTKPTLLVVDDEEGPRQSLKIVFKEDYNVLLASEGKAALEIARHHTIDVAIFDILMGGMSGVELLRRIKEIDPGIEVIMLTAYETIETARQAIRHGACDYLNKPFDVPTMRAAVARAAEKRRVTVNLHASSDRLDGLQQEIHNEKLIGEMVRSKGEIYASVLHDINSPLTVISGFIEIINRSIQHVTTVEGEKLESIKEDLSLLNGQVGRCFEISQRYLSFLHESNPDPSAVDVNQILTDLKELLLRHPSAQGNALTIQPLAQNVTTQINGTDFLQILLNLTLNALQCTDQPHEVKVQARQLDAPLSDELEESSETRFINRSGFSNKPPIVSISVEDNGPGISATHMAKLFEEKFSTKSAGKGTGLGLSIVKRLLKGASGGIRVESAPGRGSRFVLYLGA